jgi:predicted Zn-dependent peptidase
MTWLTGLSLRAWLTIGAVVIAAMWSIYVYRAGYAAADAMWQAKALESQIEKLKLEIKTQREADAAEDKLRAELDAENDQLKKVIETYVEELKSRPDKCPLGDDADKLNGL